MGVRKGWGENEEKESCVLSLFHSGHICCLCIYPVGTDRNIGGLCGWKGNVHGKKVFSLLSGKGICFFLICGVASLSIGLLEEYVWRGILLNMFLAAWGKKKNGIYCAVVVSSLGFGLCHYRNLLVGQNFADTTKQVLYAICFGMFLAALFIQTNHLFIPVLVHGLCNFSNFFMNEILGWNYTVWKYDDILQGVLAVFYLIAGLYVVYRSVQKKQNIRRKTEK